MSANKSRHQRHFASDNYAGICPEVMSTILEANTGHVPGYGNDPWTHRAEKLISKIFEKKCDVFFVSTGTAANSLALASICAPFHSIICHEFAHLETDECGAPHFFSNGAKITPVPGKNGKLSPKDIESVIQKRSDVHFVRPKAISITQSTELGTIYTPNEIKGIGKVARKFDLHLHMDGARFANAVASLRVAPKKITWQAGVDVLCLGGTKNGMLGGEAIVFFNRELAQNFRYRQKQGGQLNSKMRFIAAQWVGLLENNTWLRHAAHANHMTEKLEEKLKRISKVKILYPRQANALFVKMPVLLAKRLRQRGWRFYDDVGPEGARLMCAWDTTSGDVAALCKDIAG